MKIGAHRHEAKTTPLIASPHEAISHEAMAPTWIWQQPDWPQFRWDAERLQPLLDQVHQAREQLLEWIRALETPLAQEAVSALLGLSVLLGRESLDTAAIEGEQLDSSQVRSSIARRLGLPLADGQPQASA